MNNKLNGFTVPNNMSPTNKETQEPTIEQTPLGGSLEIGGNPSISQAHEVEVLPEDTQPQALSSTAQVIQDERIIEQTDQAIAGTGNFNTSEFGEEQLKKLKGGTPHSGYGCPNQPFAV